MTIHSFHRVIKVRHVIRSVNYAPGKTFRPRWPVPLVELAYAAGILVVFVGISRLPVIGSVSHLPFGLWWVIPVWLVAGTRMAKLDGRNPHDYAVAWVRYHRRPRRTIAGRRIPHDGQRRRIRFHVRAWHTERRA